MNKLKLLSLFSGIGAFEKALKNLGIEYDLVGYSEIDKYASKSYSKIHNIDEKYNLGDITKINEKELDKDIDLITYGFPCQDISLCGLQKGFFNKDGSKTRSGLFFDALRIIEETKPKVAIAENVKNLTSKKFKKQFKIVLDSLNEAGYNNYYKILDSKDYGIPQHRERVFIVSIRKDIDNFNFNFPNKMDLKLKLKDILEKNVDEKYFLSELMLEKATFEKKTSKFGIIEIGNLHKGGERGSIYDIDGISSTLTATDYKQPKQIFINERVRKLTPRECFRLMGFSDEDFEKANSVNSNTQLYKQTGNSIVVNVVQKILEELNKTIFNK